MSCIIHPQGRDLRGSCLSKPADDGDGRVEMLTAKSRRGTQKDEIPS